MLNQALRKEITDREEMKSLYEVSTFYSSVYSGQNNRGICYLQVFVLEDGCGKVTLDHIKAGDHVRTVLNNRKRVLPDVPVVS